MGLSCGRAQGDKFTDRIRYKELQPEKKKKKGFLTSDFSKRDEFSNTVRTAQYRELLSVRQRTGKDTAIRGTFFVSQATVCGTSSSGTITPVHTFQLDRMLTLL